MATVAAVGIAAAVAGGVTQAHAAGQAATAQETKAQQAQQLELKNQQAGIQFQQQEWAGQQQAEAPYQALGSTAANAYTNLLNNPFTAPTLSQAEQTPGYQFNLQQGTQAIAEQAAATGNLNSGNTGVALQKYGQGLATNTYQQAYQNSFNQYQTNLAAAGQGVGMGLTSTGQLGQFGQSAANNLSNLYLTGGQQQASQLNNQGAAAAAGIMGQANAYSNMYNGIANSFSQGAAMGGQFGSLGGGMGGYGGGGGYGSYGMTSNYGGPPGGTGSYADYGAPNPYSTVQAPSQYSTAGWPN
jgi:hypothetical protein